MASDMPFQLARLPRELASDLLPLFTKLAAYEINFKFMVHPKVATVTVYVESTEDFNALRDQLRRELGQVTTANLNL